MIYLTGATGYLGTWVLRRLAQHEHKVRCLLLPDDPATVAPFDGVEIVRGDITKLDTFIASGDGISAIVHCAALMLPNRADRIAAVNVQGTANMIAFAQRWGISRFIGISAVSAVYPTKNSYGVSKARAEQLVVESDLDYTILRPTMIYGGGGGLHFATLVSLIKRSPWVFPILGSGNARLQPVWIGDAISGVELSLQRPEAIRKTYNLSGATIVSFNELVDMIVDASGVRRWKVHVPLAICQAVAWLLALVTDSSVLSPDALRGITQDATLDYRQFSDECGYNPIALDEGLALAFAGTAPADMLEMATT